MSFAFLVDGFDANLLDDNLIVLLGTYVTRSLVS